MNDQPTAIDFRNAYYIKLGRGGMWEADSIESGKLRLGFAFASLFSDVRERRRSR